MPSSGGWKNSYPVTLLHRHETFQKKPSLVLFFFVLYFFCSTYLALYTTTQRSELANASPQPYTCPPWSPRHR